MSQPRTETLEADVAVVGAGLAGLVAARSLAAAGASVVVLEARPRVGGRTLNAELGGGAVVELGGQWIGPTQDRLAELAGELGVETFPTHAAGENLLEEGGRLRRYSGTVPRVSPAVIADAGQAQLRLNRLARRVPPGASWEARDAERLDSVSFAWWVRRNVYTRRGRTLIGLAARTIFGAEASDLSLLFTLAYIRSAGSLERLTDTEGGAQQDRFAGGSQLLSIRMAEQLGPRVVLGAPVRRIAHSDGDVVLTADGATARARRAVVAVPPNLAGRIAYEPLLPPLRDELTQRTAPGALRKCMAVYGEPFWRADGLSGEALLTEGPVTLTFDNSPPAGSPGVMLGFVGGSDERALGRLPPDDRRRAVLDAFERLFGPRAASPDAFLELSWSEEEWSRGGPVCCFPAGALTACGRALREPVGVLHWAGAETADVWRGYMDGAVRSGEQAAAEVLEAL